MVCGYNPFFLFGIIYKHLIQWTLDTDLPLSPVTMRQTVKMIKQLQSSTLVQSVSYITMHGHEEQGEMAEAH